jgi:hypothetical protein
MMVIKNTGAKNRDGTNNQIRSCGCGINFRVEKI